MCVCVVKEGVQGGCMMIGDRTKISMTVMYSFICSSMSKPNQANSLCIIPVIQCLMWRLLWYYFAFQLLIYYFSS